MMIRFFRGKKQANQQKYLLYLNKVHYDWLFPNIVKFAETYFHAILLYISFIYA